MIYYKCQCVKVVKKKNIQHAQVHYVGILNAARNDTQADNVR